MNDQIGVIDEIKYRAIVRAMIQTLSLFHSKSAPKVNYHVPIVYS